MYFTILRNVQLGGFGENIWPEELRGSSGELIRALLQKWSKGEMIIYSCKLLPS